jgi:gas vesicle protein
MGPSSGLEGSFPSVSGFDGGPGRIPQKGVMTMKEEIGKNKRSIIAPFAVGGLIGAGLALMLAPKSGKELREDIKSITGRTRDTISTKVSETVEKGKELYDEGAAVIKDVVDAGKMAYVREVEKHHKAA